MRRSLLAATTALTLVWPGAAYAQVAEAPNC